MASQSAIKLTKLVERFELEVLNQGKNYDRCLIRADDINRPALQILGFFDYFAPDRIQVIGKVEWTYLNNQSPEERRKCFDAFLEKPIPALILTRGLEPTRECMEMADKHDRTILRTHVQTSEFMSALISSLYNHLAPQITRSGVMMEIYGEGVLFQGESGVGKSEVAIELLKRGHRLIADDAVVIKMTNHKTLEASAPELIQGYMELRGIGVVDVSRLMGMGAIKMSQQIDLVVNLEPWDDNAVYDRFGLESAFTEIMGVKVPAVTIPVKPGRNLASIVEVAAMNNRNRKMGHNAALELTHRMDRHFQTIEEGGK